MASIKCFRQSFSAGKLTSGGLLLNLWHCFGVRLRCVRLRGLRLHFREVAAKGQGQGNGKLITSQVLQRAAIGLKVSAPHQYPSCMHRTELQVPPPRCQARSERDRMAPTQKIEHAWFMPLPALQACRSSDLLAQAPLLSGSRGPDHLSSKVVGLPQPHV